MAILWEIPFCVLFLIVLSIWFTDDYYVYYENMRNEKEKSFSAKWSFYASFSYKYHINESNWGMESTIKPLSLYLSFFPLILMSWFFNCSLTQTDSRRTYAPACDIIMCIPLVVSAHNFPIHKKYVLQHRYASAL